MKKIRYFMRQVFTATIITLLLGVAPAPLAFAEDPAPDPNAAATTTQTEQPPVEKPKNGTNGPTGSASGTYTYNEGSGLWENDYYIYNPSTKETSPKQPLEYTYNPATGLWDTYVWQFSASKGAYSQTLVSVTAPPAGAITHGAPQPVVEQTQNAANTGSDTPSTPQSNEKTTSSDPQNGTSTGQNQNTGTALTFNNSGTITNFIDSTARTGNALVISNTTAGNAGSGNASAMTNLVNLLQSQSSFGGNGFATFTTNIQGNVTGDFLIDPAALTQPANIGSQNLANYKLTDKTDGTILNDVNLNANSGDATATKNTSAGNITTGDANAIANVVNMINSVVAANQSFMGVVNIYGDYTGNILVPTDSLNALLGSTGSGASTTVGQSADTTVNSNTEQNITNNVNLAAVSGTATASENTRSGNVASGNGLTNLTILNLTGRQVVAANSLLVFVNVLGTWVGLIMDAPAGSTAAAFGGGVAADTAVATAGTDTDINSTQKFGITNNINANAGSGNAAATKNTSVGDVKSGNATASANVANFIGSNLSLANWFGILFINVFGTWRGNFGVAKPPVVAPVTSGVSGPSSGVAQALGSAKVFAFTPTHSSGGSKLGLSPLSEAHTNAAVTSADMVEKVSKVLSASVGKDLQQPATITDPNADDFNWSALMVAIGLTGFGFVGMERVRSILRNRKTS